MLCPRDVVYLISVFGRRDGVTEITFATKDGTRKKVNTVTGGPTLLQRTWDMLDAELDAIIANQFGDEAEILKHKTRARAIAEVLAMFMVPHFETADEIAKEAGRRHKAKLDGDTEYETPGLGSRKFEPPAGTRSLASEARDKSPRRAAKKSAAVAQKRMPSEAIPGAKQALEMKMMTVAQIAKMYGVTEDEVKRAVGA